MTNRTRSRTDRFSPRSGALKKLAFTWRGIGMASVRESGPIAEKTAPRSTLTASVYEQLRSDLLGGNLKPGEKLRVEALRSRFAAGSSPVREALNRLLSEGYVALEEQRGFRVAPVSRDELGELVVARCWIDGAAIAESVRKFEASWEENLILALHRLSKVTRGECRNLEWETRHKALHLALVSGCGTRWVIACSSQLFDAAERYRLLGAADVSERNEFEEHRAIVNACLQRDSAQAIELLKAHYGRTFNVILKSLERSDKKISHLTPALKKARTSKAAE